MNSSLSTLALVVSLGLSGAAQAALIDRGGGLIYDDVLDVTWLQDANYAKTSQYDADGKMTWSAATTWASSLSYYDAVRGVSYDDWRLPTVLDTGKPGPQQAMAGGDAGYNVDTDSSEFAHLYHVDLGNLSRFETTFPVTQRPVYGLVNKGPFDNFQNLAYWFGTEDASNSTRAWYFAVDNGFQTTASKTSYTYYALAVRDGDVAAVAAVPVPQTVALMLGGLGLIGWRAKRRG